MKRKENVKILTKKAGKFSCLYTRNGCGGMIFIFAVLNILDTRINVNCQILIKLSLSYSRILTTKY